MPHRTRTRNIMLRNMTSAAHSSRIYYVRQGFRLNGMVLIVLEYYYSSNGRLTIVLANGTNIYHVSIVPRNHFSNWIPNGIITNTMTPALPNANNIWSLPYVVMNYASRFADVNHGPNLMPYPPHRANVHMGLLARQDQAGNVNRGLRREIIFARMNRVMYQLTEISTSDEDTCSICLDYYSDGQIIGSTDCHHTFHFDCINQWLMQVNSCPICRRTALAV
uniref:RING-type E3 ubiquitin transferase n=1 Tax=Solanum lycopersicum TaxID=4081 RepID=A0A3Q7J6F3_SOLLC